MFRIFLRFILLFVISNTFSIASLLIHSNDTLQLNINFYRKFILILLFIFDIIVLTTNEWYGQWMYKFRIVTPHTPSQSNKNVPMFKQKKIVFISSTDISILFKNFSASKNYLDFTNSTDKLTLCGTARRYQNVPKKEYFLNALMLCVLWLGYDMNCV